MEDLTDWQRGKPPSVGWWNASLTRNPKVRRWWNGSYYSEPIYVGIHSDEYTEKMKLKVDYSVSAKHIYYRGLKAPRSE